MGRMTFTSTTEDLGQMQAELGGGSTTIASVPATPATTTLETPTSTSGDDQAAPADEAPAKTDEGQEPKDEAPAPAKPEPPAASHDDDLTDEEFSRLSVKAQRRIAKLTRKMREAEAEAVSLRTAPPPAPPAAVQTPAPVSPATETNAGALPPELEGVDVGPIPPGFRNFPTDDQFDTYQKAQIAQMKWLTDLKVEQERHASLQREAATQQSRVISSYVERENKVKADHPDYDAAIARPVAMKYPQQQQMLNGLLLEAQDAAGGLIGPDVAYYLATTDTARDMLLNAPNPQAFVLRFGAIARDVELARTASPSTVAPTAPTVRQPSTPPPAPLRPVSGANAAASASVDLDRTTYKEDEARWKAELDAKRRARGGR